MLKKSKKTQTNSYEAHEKYKNIAYVFLIPWIIGFVVFQLYPFVASFWYSFTDYNVVSDAKFVGFENYIKIITADKTWRKSLGITFKYVAIAVPCKIAFAFIIAMLLNMKLRTINFFRTVYYLPSILGGSVAVSILWRFIFRRDGVMNSLLSVFGIGAIDWLGSPKYALYTLSVLVVWQFGSSMIVFLAGLKQIPQDLYEAANMDGAGKLRRFNVITLPMISPMIFFNLVMQLVFAFQEFTGAFVVTNGGPVKSTYLYALMLYENAFGNLKMGYASAQSWILFLIIVVVTTVVFKFSDYWVYYADGGKTND